MLRIAFASVRVNTPRFNSSELKPQMRLFCAETNAAVQLDSSRSSIMTVCDANQCRPHSTSRHLTFHVQTPNGLYQQSIFLESTSTIYFQPGGCWKHLLGQWWIPSSTIVAVLWLWHHLQNVRINLLAYLYSCPPPLVSYPRFSSMHRRWFLRLWRRTRALEVVGSTSDCSTVV